MDDLQYMNEIRFLKHRRKKSKSDGSLYTNLLPMYCEHDKGTPGEMVSVRAQRQLKRTNQDGPR